MDLVITRVTGQKKCTNAQPFDFCPRKMGIWREGNYPRYVERKIEDKCLLYNDAPAMTLIEEEIRFETVDVGTPFKIEFAFHCADVVNGPRPVFPGGPRDLAVDLHIPRSDKFEYLYTVQNVQGHDKTVAIDIEYRLE